MLVKYDILLQQTVPVETRVIVVKTVRLAVKVVVHVSVKHVMVQCDKDKCLCSKKSTCCANK